jgi:hypothetical protein
METLFPEARQRAKPIVSGKRGCGGWNTAIHSSRGTWEGRFPPQACRSAPARLPVPILRRLGRVGASLKPLEQIVIIKPADAQGAGMARTHRPASPVGGCAGGAAIGRDVADRQPLAAAFNGGDGF